MTSAGHSSDEHHQGHEHGHGHEHDQGITGMLRYLRHAPKMWRSEVNDAVVARLAPTSHETALDIGAGIGAGTMAAVKSGSRVVAVEPTPYMRRILQLRCVLARVGDRVRIVDGTAEATTLDADTIDAGWAVNTMHHWTNLDAGVAELARVIAPGGRVLLVDEDFEDPTHPDFESFGSKRADDHSHHFPTVDPKVVEAAMKHAGMTVTFAGHDSIAGRPSIVVEASHGSDQASA